MTTTVESHTTITVTLKVDHGETGKVERYDWSLEEAIAIKDELIRLVGAQSAIKPVKRDNSIPQNKMAIAWCGCGNPARSDNGSCGPSGCNNVPA